MLIRNMLKVVPATVLQVFFEIQMRALAKIGKMVFISLQKLFLFLRKSSFRILNIQVS